MKPTALTLTLSRANLCLQSGHGLSLTDAAGAEVTARSGRVWVTMEGDARDVDLTPGNAYTIERDGLTLVSALEPSLVQIRMRRHTGFWRERFEQFWLLLQRGAEIRARARLARRLRI